MSSCRSFPPSADEHARVLILGSMPGGESLRQSQYYAFERNLFWPIMGEIFSFDPAAPYLRRLELLKARHVALWDVIYGCERSGSLDAAIRSPVPNDIPALLARCPAIVGICCNGRAAADHLHRFFPELRPRVEVLPSTSPAAAALSRKEKLLRWREALRGFGIL